MIWKDCYQYEIHDGIHPTNVSTYSVDMGGASIKFINSDDLFILLVQVHCFIKQNAFGELLLSCSKIRWQHRYLALKIHDWHITKSSTEGIIVYFAVS